MCTVYIVFTVQVFLFFFGGGGGGGGVGMSGLIIVPGHCRSF